MPAGCTVEISRDARPPVKDVAPADQVLNLVPCRHRGMPCTEGTFWLERIRSLRTAQENQILEKYWLGRQDSNLGMAVPKTAALPLGDAPKTRAKRTNAHAYTGHFAKAQSPRCRLAAQIAGGLCKARRLPFGGRTTGKSCYAPQTASSLPAGSTKWKRRPPGNEKTGRTIVPPAFSTTSTVSSRFSE